MNCPNTKRVTHVLPALVLHNFPIYKLFCLNRCNLNVGRFERKIYVIRPTQSFS